MPIQLPDSYWVQREPQGTLAILRTYYDALTALGYGVDTDGERVASELKGRGNLEEYHLPGPLGSSADSPPPQVLVIRKFRRGGWVRFANKDRFLDPERPFREIQLSLALTERGFWTPPVVAARSFRLGILGYRLEVITVRVQGAKSLGRWLESFRAEPFDFKLLRRMAASFGCLVREMHAAGFLHSDLQPENFLWQETEGALNSVANLGANPGRDRRAAKIWILDLDRSRLVDPGMLALGVRSKNLWRLWRYVLRREGENQRVLTQRDYGRFLKAYEPDRKERKRLFSELLRVRSQRSRWHR